MRIMTQCPDEENALLGFRLRIMTQCRDEENALLGYRLRGGEGVRAHQETISLWPDE